jgi:peptide/nickel transport system ATP-binding protein
MTAVLAVHDLHVAIGGRGSAANVLRGASLEVGAGEVRGLVGESGAGKSMLGRAVLGLLPANAVIGAGTIQFEGRDLLAMPEPERRSLLGRRIALIPQDPTTSLNPVKRVGAQIAFLLRHHLALSKRDARERAAELLAEVAIREPRRVLELYTRALLAATPRADRPAEELRPVPAALIESLWSEAHRLDRHAVTGPP